MSLYLLPFVGSYPGFQVSPLLSLCFLVEIFAASSARFFSSLFVPGTILRFRLPLDT